MTLQDELEAMLQRARRYIESAEALRLRSDFDSAVSRLYYAMFYCAEAMLRARYEFVATLEEPEVLEMTSQARQFLSITHELSNNEGHL